MIFYSKSTGGFYDSDLHSLIPGDRVEVTIHERSDLLAGEASGKVIVADERGAPFLMDPLPPTADDLASDERKWRDSQVSATEWLVTRHRDELDMQQPTTLTAEQFAKLLTYRQELRDWPLAPDFPNASGRPVEPEWLASQVK